MAGLIGVQGDQGNAIFFKYCQNPMPLPVGPSRWMDLFDFIKKASLLVQNIGQV
jgi:hypothetical protein